MEYILMQINCWFDRNSFSNIMLGICSALLCPKHLLNNIHFCLSSYILLLKEQGFFSVKLFIRDGVTEKNHIKQGVV